MTAPGTETITEDPTPDVDPAAPYGYKQDGTPKAGPGGRPPVNKPATKRPSTKRRLGFGTPSKTTRTKPAATPKTGTATDYTESIEGVASIIGALLSFASPMDAAAWHLGTPNIVKAVNTTAQKRAEIAAWCERMNLIGPYGLIFAAVLPVGAQCLVNHGWVPLAFGRRFGAVPPEILAYRLAKMVEQQESETLEAEYSDPEFQAWLAAQQAAQNPPAETPTEPQPEPGPAPFTVVPPVPHVG